MLALGELDSKEVKCQREGVLRHIAPCSTPNGRHTS